MNAEVTLKSLFGSPKDAVHTQVALFKEGASRIVAASKSCVMYTMKTKSHVRVIVLKVPGNPIAFKAHTSDVLSIKFVNSTSNVVASISEKELLVWFVNLQHCATEIYFKVNQRIRAFTWILDLTFPDLLVVQDDKISVLKSSALIQTYKKGDEQVAQESHFEILPKKVKGESALVCSGGPFMGFTVDEQSIVTCTSRNYNTPSWKPCTGVLLDISMMENRPILLAHCPNSVSIWNVESEPRQLYRIIDESFGNYVCRCIGGSAVFLMDVPEAHVVTITDDGKIGCSSFRTSGRIKRESCAVTMDSPTDVCVTAVVGDELCFHVFDVSAVPLVASQEVRSVLPPQPQLPPQQQVQLPEARPHTQDGPPLRNPTLPHASHATPLMSEVDEMQQQVEVLIQNALQILSISKKKLVDDYSRLTEEVLLGALSVFQERLQNQGESVDPSSLLVDIAQQLPRAIVDGIAPAVENTLTAQLEDALKHSVVASRKAEQAAVKERMDSMMKEASELFVAEFEKREDQYKERLSHAVSQLSVGFHRVVQKFQQQIELQQEALKSVMESGLLEEVRRLRSEVKLLRERKEPQTPQQSPETVLSNAQTLLKRSENTQALRWVAEFPDFGPTVVLLCTLDQEARTRLLEDTAVPDVLWEKCLAHLASIQNVDEVASVARWITDILLERRQLKKGDSVCRCVETFVKKWGPTATGLLKRTMTTLQIALRD